MVLASHLMQLRHGELLRCQTLVRAADQIQPRNLYPVLFAYHSSPTAGVQAPDYASTNVASGEGTSANSMKSMNHWKTWMFRSLRACFCFLREIYDRYSVQK